MHFHDTNQNFASLSLVIPLQRRQGRPKLSHLHHQAVSTPSSPSGTTFEPFLACSRLDLTCNSTGIGFTAPDGISCSPTRAADGGPNSNLPRIRSRLSHHHLQARPPKTLLAYLLAVLMSNAMGIGHAAFRRFQRGALRRSGGLSVTYRTFVGRLSDVCRTFVGRLSDVYRKVYRK